MSKKQALQQYLRKPDHQSTQPYQLFKKFLLYVKLVQDPLNVFRYMEEKSLCIFLTNFWVTKSEYLAEIADYRNAFACLGLAESRVDLSQHEQSQTLIDIKQKTNHYRDQISNELNKYPPNKRRTISDFTLMNNKFQDIPGTDKQKHDRLVEMIENKFPSLKREKQKQFAQKNSEKPKSWLFDVYELQQKQIYGLVNQVIKMNASQTFSRKFTPIQPQANQQSDERLFKSVCTPFKRRDPMRITKTVDSVQMMRRKKKSTIQKKKKIQSPFQKHLQKSGEQDQQQESESNMCINTLPVGGKFGIMKKHVKFGSIQYSSNTKIEHMRGNDQNEQSSLQVGNLFSRKPSVHKGILRNRTDRSEDFKPLRFQNIDISPISIRKCQEIDIGSIQIPKQEKSQE